MADPHAPHAPSAPEVDNRRNHYRVLHVQPEAPTEVIKASYRTLMTQLKGHPDLGGSHVQAAMINAAWAVLGDPERRAAYDRLLRRGGHLAPRTAAGHGFRPMTPAAAAGQGGRSTSPHAAASSRAPPPPPSPPPAPRAAAPPPRPAPGAGPPAAAPATAAASSRAVSVPPSVMREHHCALCGQLCLSDPRPDARCLRCHAPLAALPAPGSPGHELLGRRGASRREQAHVAMLRIGWPSPELPVRWRDLSLTGVSFFAPQPLAAGQRIHLSDQALEAVAEVVVSRPQGRLYTVHARLLTAVLLQPTGVFVCAQA